MTFKLFDVEEKKWENQPQEDIVETKKRATHPDYLYINEEFYSIQGEGLHTGVPMYFVRLQGCEVGCYFCDTKYTWRAAPEKKKSICEIFENILESRCQWVCVTGGEPYEQDFYYLCELCNNARIKVHVETSGTEWLNLPVNWITLSPKDLFSKKKTLTNFKVTSDEIKVVVTKPEDIKYYHHEYYPFCSSNKPLIFQMVDNSEANLQETLSYIHDNDLRNARIMMQQHKVFQLR
jgi:organic radical activating enzyme